MWSTQLKEIAKQLSKSNTITERLSIILENKTISTDERRALKLAYATPNGVNIARSSANDYWM